MDDIRDSLTTGLSIGVDLLSSILEHLLPSTSDVDLGPVGNESISDSYHQKVSAFTPSVVVIYILDHRAVS